MKNARIVADEIHPGMHRIQWPDGRLSDMANLSRINDAAARFNECLDRELRGRQKPTEARTRVLESEKAA